MSALRLWRLSFSGLLLSKYYTEQATWNPLNFTHQHTAVETPLAATEPENQSSSIIAVSFLT